MDSLYGVYQIFYFYHFRTLTRQLKAFKGVCHSSATWEMVQLHPQPRCDQTITRRMMTTKTVDLFPNYMNPECRSFSARKKTMKNPDRGLPRFSIRGRVDVRRARRTSKLFTFPEVSSPFDDLSDLLYLQEHLGEHWRVINRTGRRPNEMQ